VREFVHVVVLVHCAPPPNHASEYPFHTAQHEKIADVFFFDFFFLHIAFFSPPFFRFLFSLFSCLFFLCCGYLAQNL